MHEIEPYHRWLEFYTSERDENSPFHGREAEQYDRYNSVYNYVIHPFWEDFGSATLYTKLLYCNYDIGCAILQFLGEWNDLLYNDIMFLKRFVIDHLLDRGISKFVLILDNVLIYHGSDLSYYQEWMEEINERNGWVCAINLSDEVRNEMNNNGILNFFINLDTLNDIEWRKMDPLPIFKFFDSTIENLQLKLSH